MKIFLIVVFVALVIMESGEMSYLLPSWFAGGEFDWLVDDDEQFLMISFKDGSVMFISNVNIKKYGLMVHYYYTGLEYETAGRICKFASNWPVNWIARKLTERR